jgi:hypothetical protein
MKEILLCKNLKNLAASNTCLYFLLAVLIAYGCQFIPFRHFSFYCVTYWNLLYSNSCTQLYA